MISLCASDQADTPQVSGRLNGHGSG